MESGAVGDGSVVGRSGGITNEAQLKEDTLQKLGRLSEGSNHFSSPLFVFSVVKTLGQDAFDLKVIFILDS